MSEYSLRGNLRFSPASPKRLPCLLYRECYIHGTYTHTSHPTARRGAVLPRRALSKWRGRKFLGIPPSAAVSAPCLLGWLLILPRPLTHAAPPPSSSYARRKSTVVLKPEYLPSSLSEEGRADKNLRNKSWGLEQAGMNEPLVRERS